MIYDSALILEGGGMRGIYTAGVLDFFLDKNIDFKSCYGVSAGACHCCSYLSKQKGRAFKSNVEYLKDKNYCSLYSLIKTGDLFGAEMLYDTIPNKLLPYDYEAFDKNPAKFKAVVTNCSTGKAEYLEITDLHKDIISIRASASLPLLSRIVQIDGREYLDGGIGDPIPVRKSLEDGNVKNVVILTQHHGYKKSPNSLLPLLKRKYKNYPKLINTIESRHINYNDTLAFIEEEKKAGRLFVIQPKEPITIKRIEKDKQKLTKLYNSGYKDAENLYEELLSFLNK